MFDCHDWFTKNKPVERCSALTFQHLNFYTLKKERTFHKGKGIKFVNK